VTQYRTTARVKEYNSSYKQLPQPYFPIVFPNEFIRGNALLQAIFDEQNKIIVSRKDIYSSSYFTIGYEVDVEDSRL